MACEAMPDGKGDAVAAVTAPARRHGGSRPTPLRPPRAPAGASATARRGAAGR
jgi:hypothetical protein